MTMNLMPFEPQPQSFAFANILALWNSLPDSTFWGAVDWIYGIQGKPALVMLGASEANGGETFAVLDVFERRVLTTDEFPADEVEQRGLEVIPDGPALPTRKALGGRSSP